MKIIHTADWHLGKNFFGKSLLQDQIYFIDKIFFPLIEKEKPDAVILAGDIFDRQIPSAESIPVFDKVITKINKMNIPFVAVTGNHDGAKRLSLGTELLRANNIIISTKPSDIFSPFRIKTKDGVLSIYTLPYCEPSEIKSLLNDEKINSMDTAFRALTQNVKINPVETNILVTHCFAAGGKISASENPAFVGGSAQVGADIFEKFDYTALGHLHGPQKICKARYSGSPLCYSFDEENQHKGITIVNIKDKKAEIKSVDIIPLHKVRTISGYFDDLYNNAQQNYSEDYIQIELLNTEPIYLPAEKLRIYYPNLMSLTSKWLMSRGTAQNNNLRNELHGKNNSMNIFKEFMKQICGTEAETEECNLITKLIGSKESEE